MSKKDERSTDEILTIGSIVAIIIFIFVGAGVFADKLAELKDNTPVVFWLVIAGTIIGVILLIFGVRRFLTYIKNKS